MPRRLRREDLSFLARAPAQQVHRGLVGLPVERVFAGLVAHPEGWPAWFTPARACHYEGVPPHGVGAVRLLSLRGGIRAHERVLAWDQNERCAYCADEVNVPGIRVRGGVDAPPVRLLLQAARHRMDLVFGEATRRMATVV